MVDYQGNSNKSKETPANPDKPKKNLEKVVSGEVIVKSQGVGAKFKSIFFGGDATTASHYVVGEVILPALRNLVVEVVSKGIDRLIYGESAARRRPSSYAPRVQYNNPIYRQEPRAYLPNQRPSDRWAEAGKRQLDKFIVSSRVEADMVVDTLTEAVSQYEVVSVADLNELLGLASSHVDQKWGWTNLSNIGVRQVREGYEISLPPLEEIS